MNAQKRGLFSRLLLVGAGVLLAQAPLAGFAQDKPVSGGTLNVIVQPEPPALMLTRMDFMSGTLPRLCRFFPSR